MEQGATPVIHKIAVLDPPGGVLDRYIESFQLEDQMLRDFTQTTDTFLDRVHRMLRAKGRSMAQTFVSYQAGFGILLVMLGYVVLVEGRIRFDDVALVIVQLTAEADGRSILEPATLIAAEQ